MFWFGPVIGFASYIYTLWWVPPFWGYCCLVALTIAAFWAEDLRWKEQQEEEARERSQQALMQRRFNQMLTKRHDDTWY